MCVADVCGDYEIVFLTDDRILRFGVDASRLE